VAPPRSDAVTGIIPPIPDAKTTLTPSPAAPPGAPIEVADEPVGPVGNGSLQVSAEERPPILDRLEELRKRAEERRQQRKDKREEKKPLPPSPFAPKGGEGPLGKAAPGEGSDLAAVQKLVESAARKWAEVEDFEARLVKKEVVNGKQMPRDEVLFRYRRQPLSVYMKTLSEAGQGREVMYVKGQFGDKLHIVTGKGDNALVGAGYKTELDPDSRMATQRSRQKVTEAGFGRPIAGLQQAIAAAESGKPVVLKSLGAVRRSEYPEPLEGVELTLRPGQDPSMPKGGKRQFFFDSNPGSPSYLLPVLVTAQEPDGREVEYYCFDRFRLPANFPLNDWHPDRLGSK
jgi:hypothetical protein